MRDEDDSVWQPGEKEHVHEVAELQEALAYERERVKKLREQLADKQATRWTSTYNTIVGAAVNGSPDGFQALDVVSARAHKIATDIHGELAKPVE